MTRSILVHRGAVWALGLFVGLTVTSGRLTSSVARSGQGPAGQDEATAAPGPREVASPAEAPELSPTPSAPSEAPATPPTPAPAADAPAESAEMPSPPAASPPATEPASAPVPTPTAARTRAAARVVGTAAPGLRVELHGEDSRGTDLRFRWVQTRGPSVALRNASSGTAEFTAPAGEGPLGFLLVVAGPDGSDTAELSVPIEGLPRAPANSLLHADAGDDQLGLIGRQVNLNAVRSGPRGQIGYRWVQTGGPAVRFKLEDGYIYSFVPTAPGVYRFAVVVAAGSEISAPDEVTVTVGQAAGSSAGPADERAVPMQEVARAGLASLSGGADAALPMAQVFDDAAARMDLYRSYGDAFSEISRRLEEMLPAEPARRAFWVERLFNPLSQRTLEVMRAEGLDLRQPGDQSAALTAAQRAALAEQFRLISEGLRSAAGRR